MDAITWDSVILFVIIIGALAFLLRKFTLPTTRCGCGSSCGGCDGNTHRSRKKIISEGSCECSDSKVNKCYMLDESAKRNAK